MNSEASKSSEFVDENGSINGPNLPHGFTDHCSTIINSTHAVLTGGRGLNHMPTLFVNIANDFYSMREGPILSTERYGHGCSVIHRPDGSNFLIVAGGYRSGNGDLDTVAILDTSDSHNLWQMGMY